MKSLAAAYKYRRKFSPSCSLQILCRRRISYRGGGHWLWQGGCPDVWPRRDRTWPVGLRIGAAGPSDGPGVASWCRDDAARPSASPSPSATLSAAISPGDGVRVTPLSSGLTRFITKSLGTLSAAGGEAFHSLERRWKGAIQGRTQGDYLSDEVDAAVPVQNYQRHETIVWKRVQAFTRTDIVIYQ
jgi:hypothetical protein